MLINLPQTRLAGLAVLAFASQLATSGLLNYLWNPARGVLVHWLFHGTISLALLLFAYIAWKNDGNFSIWWRSSLIGACFTFGLLLSRQPSMTVSAFGWYAMLLASFHLSEYLATAFTNPVNLSTDSFLLNHSLAYHVAAVASWAEFWLEHWLAPGWKSRWSALTWVGVVLCIVGELLRKLAMWQAGRSFNHIIQSTKRDDHLLVTSGLFSLVRHPSYLGWFLWSIGTQLVLRNPLCLVAYTVASWRFFSERIYFEEYTLMQFFGQEYEDYMKKVPCGIPFVRSYPLSRVER